MAIPTTIEIYIDSIKIEAFQDFVLTEEMGGHASFELMIGNPLLEIAKGNGTALENSKAFLNKTIAVQATAVTKSGTYEPMRFMGVVTHVNQSIGYASKDQNFSKVSGKGCSIVLEDGPHLDSFDQVNLSEMVREVTRPYHHPALKMKVNPERDIQIPYSVQYMESGFEYLKRLAATHGEYLCYAEDTLYFGKPEFDREVTLTESEDLLEYCIGISPQAQKFEYYSPDYQNEGTISSGTAGISGSNAPMHTYANRVSNELYGHTSLVQQDIAVTSGKQHLDTLVGLQKKVIEQQQVTLEGVSDNPGVGLGKQIRVQSRSGNGASYRVVKVTHNCKDLYSYENTFTAISLDTDVYPLTDIGQVQKGEPSIAKVTDTNDPQQMSRVRVQYPWQAPTGKNTPWVRVATAYAGGDRGVLFIPEVGDQVMLGYENSNKNLPYVQAALYTGVNKHTGWQSENNDYKGFTTKGGHVIELVDTPDGEKITIKDKNDNRIQIDTVNKSILISAPENIDIVAKNINITAKENIRLGAEQNIGLSATQDLSALANANLALQSSNDTTVKSKGKLAMEATGDMTVKGQKAIVEGTATTEINGTTTKISGSTLAEVSGGIVKVN